MMELHSTENSVANNPETMSILEYLSSKGYEVMATRNILHISKLQEFENFLEPKGYKELVAYEWLKQPVED